MDPIQGRRRPVIRYLLKQTALLGPLREGSHLWFLTASTRLHLTQGKNWPPFHHSEV